MDAKDKELPTRYYEHSVVWLYNHTRLHSALGYVTPDDKLADRQPAIFAARDQKLAAARERQAAQRTENTRQFACEDGTQRKASGVQGAAMSPLVARAVDGNSPHRPTEGETESLTFTLNPLTAPTQNSNSR